MHKVLFFWWCCFVQTSLKTFKDVALICFCLVCLLCFFLVDSSLACLLPCASTVYLTNVPVSLFSWRKNVMSDSHAPIGEYFDVLDDIIYDVTYGRVMHFLTDAWFVGMAIVKVMKTSRVHTVTCCFLLLNLIGNIFLLILASQKLRNGISYMWVWSILWDRRPVICKVNSDRYSDENKWVKLNFEWSFVL